MSTENSETVKLSAIFAAALVVIVISGEIYWAHYNYTMAKVIEDGTDAQEAVCAFQDDYGKNPACLVLRGKQECTN